MGEKSFPLLLYLVERHSPLPLWERSYSRGYNFPWKSSHLQLQELHELFHFHIWSPVLYVDLQNVIIVQSSGVGPSSQQGKWIVFVSTNHLSVKAIIYPCGRISTGLILRKSTKPALTNSSLYWSFASPYSSTALFQAPRKLRPVARGFC